MPIAKFMLGLGFFYIAYAALIWRCFAPHAGK
jgi:hypothetical protein